MRLKPDGNSWFLKYILQPNEYNLLVNEMVGVALAHHFGIPYASAALATIDPDSFSEGDFKFNKLATAGSVCFASREIENTDIVNELETVEDRPDFNKLSNPSDLIKISLFDMLTDNIDRCRKNNYNILFKKDSNTFIAIDHALIFSGNDRSGIFDPNHAVSVYSNIMQTPYFKKIVKFIPEDERKRVFDEFMYLCNSEIVTIIADVFSEVPPSWILSAGLKDNMAGFLLDDSRINSIKKLALPELVAIK
ncbi:MAG: HipA family kinase [Bacteroidota bacterium]